MTSKEALQWIKNNYLYLIEEYYNKPVDSKQCVIDMGKPKFFIIEEDLERLEELEDEYINLREKYNDLKAKIKYHIEYAYNYLKECADE